MRYRLSEMVTAINAALNYPAITYDDISVYLDMCVSEINTTLHVGLRSFREYAARSRADFVREHAPDVAFQSEPSGASGSVPCISDVSDAHAGNWYYWAESEDHPEWSRRFVHCASDGEIDSYKDRLFGVCALAAGGPKHYEAHPYSDALVLWVASDEGFDIDVAEFLPEDWINLFVIPYVCFKYAVRDGGVASTFAEELEQGFQQLQEYYDVPHAVRLADVAGLPAYRWDVEKALAEGMMGAKCVTRAITASMRHERNVMPEYGSMDDRGGWGV